MAFTQDTGELFIGAASYPDIAWRKSTATRKGLFPFTNLKILTETDVTKNVVGQINARDAMLSSILYPTDNNPGTALTMLVEYQHSFVFDYSIISQGNETETRPRRVGTMRIITNSTECSIIDTYAELKGSEFETTGVVFDAGIEHTDSGVLNSTRLLRITYTNSNDIAFRFQAVGRIW